MSPNMYNVPRVMLIEKSSLSMRQLSQLITELLDCELLAYDNARDALISISQKPPDLIVTEWDLPDLRGDELIQALRSHRDLKAIPIIICTSNPREEIRRRAGELSVTDLLPKPVNRILLQERLNALLNRSGNPIREEPETKTFNDFRSQIQDIRTLAPLPTSVKNILEITNDPSSSARNLAEVVKVDQSLTSKILQIVNSAYYGFYREIGNIDHAVVILGFNEITNITLAACIIQTYRNGHGEYFDRERFWVHTLGAAYIARSLKPYIPELISKDAFVIGLLHDLGKVVLDQHYKEIFHRVLKAAHEQNRPLHEVSRELLGIDHAEIGGLVADSWNLPIPLVNAIRHHHNPDLANRQDYGIHLAHLANYFAHRQHIGASGNPVPDAPHPETLKVFGFDAKDLDSVWNSLNINSQALSKILI